MWLLAIGLLLNTVATVNNHGMPYSPDALAAAGVIPNNYSDLPRRTPTSHPEGPGDQLSVLGDRIPIAPLRTVVSFGDVFVAFGLGAVIANAMIGGTGRRWRRHEPRHRAASGPNARAHAAPPLETSAVDTSSVGTNSFAGSAGGSVLAGSVVALGSEARDPLGGALFPVATGAMSLWSAEAVGAADTPDLARTSTEDDERVAAEAAHERAAITAWKTRLAVVRITGDASALVDVTDGRLTDPTDIALSHALTVALRDNDFPEETVRSVVRSAVLDVTGAVSPEAVAIGATS
jgi:hypothetical protein